MKNGNNKNSGEVPHKTLMMHRVAAAHSGLLVDVVGIAQVSAAGPFANVKLDHDLQQIF